MAVSSDTYLNDRFIVYLSQILTVTDGKISTFREV